MNTLFVGRNRIDLPETDSTNNYALQNPGLPDGTLITAAYQTGGKGQRGRIWSSNRGENLLFSIVFRPTFLQPAAQFSLNKAVAVSVYASLKQLFPATDWAIKWPNDIYAGNRKLAGILSESQLSTGQIVSYVAGIGLNLNQDEFPGISPEPVSIKMLTGMEQDPESVLSEICNRLEIAYLGIRRGDLAAVDAQFNDALWKRGEEISFLHQGIRQNGKLIESDRMGRLVVHCPDGLRYFQTGEISWII